MNRQTIQINIESPWRVAGQVAIAPVTIMVEGVHHGSHGPLYWASHILRENTPKWNGVPVCFDHPMANGQPVSIKRKSKDHIIGYVRRPYFDESKQGIRAEVEVNADLLTQVQGIREVSAGVFSDEQYTSGTWNGEQFEACSITMEPDHLALLTTQRGACSWEDGCGIRNNARQLFEAAITTYVNNLIKGVNTMPEQEILLPTTFIDNSKKPEDNEDEKSLIALQAEADKEGILLPTPLNARPVSADKTKWSGSGEEPLLPIIDV